MTIRKVSIEEARYALLGLVVNPKEATLALAEWDGGAEVSIRSLQTWRQIGWGYFETSERDNASLVSLCPRVHTPQGVTEPGRGYGTSLYTALTVAASAASDGFLIKTGSARGACISSEVGSRSDEAERWWTRAKARGVAHEIEGTIEYTNWEDFPEDLESQNGLLECMPAEWLAHIDDKGHFVSVVGLQILRSHVVRADVYAYESAQQNNLVALYRPIPMDEYPYADILQSLTQDCESYWADMSDDLTYVNIGLLLSADVRGLSEGALNLILAACRYGGASEKELEGVRFRWEHRLDPKMPAEHVEQALQPNGPDRKKAREILETTAYLRSETGWDELADLP